MQFAIETGVENAYVAVNVVLAVQTHWFWFALIIFMVWPIYEKF